MKFLIQPNILCHRLAYSVFSLSMPNSLLRLLVRRMSSVFLLLLPVSSVICFTCFSGADTPTFGMAFT